MTCQDAREAFTDMVDGTLSGEPLADFNAHLRGCPACRQEWSAFRRTLDALAEVRDEGPSPGFAARVAARIEAPRRWQRAAAALLFPLRVKLPVHATALVVLGAMGLWLFQRSAEVRQGIDLAPPPSAERPAPTAAPEPPLAPPSEPRRETAQPPPKPKSSAVRPIRPPSAPSEAREAPVPAAEPMRTSQAPPAEDQAGTPSGAAPPTAADAEKTEATAPRSLRAAPAPGESRLRSESPRPAMPDAPIAAKERRLAAPTSAGPAALVSDAKAAMAARDFAKAVERLQALLAQHPTDERARDAHLLLADAYRAQRRYGEAINEVEAFLRRYPDDRAAPGAWYRRAELRLESGDPAGCAMIREALSRYPDAREAVSARDTLSARCP